MEQKTDLQRIGEGTKDQWNDFWKLVEPFRSELWGYCRKLTGSPWDAEDLIQDSLLKAFASLSSLSHRTQSLKVKPYIFRIATNHWIDLCRKNKVSLIPFDDVANNIIQAEEDSLIINEAIEMLVYKLPPKQAAVLILMESFQFTAKETADLITSTETAVHALLRRARMNLLALQKRNLDKKMKTHYENNRLDKDVIKKFIHAYNQRDFQKISNLLDDHAVFSFVEQSSKEYGKNAILKYSLASAQKEVKHTNIEVYNQLIWGKEALVFVTTSENNKKMLHDINLLEMEEEKIINWQCYYFCRDFMKTASIELGLPLEPIN